MMNAATGGFWKTTDWLQQPGGNHQLMMMIGLKTVKKQKQKTLKLLCQN